METVPIPSNAIGRPGMVAMLQRVKPEVEGRTVAVRLAVGPVTSLANSAKPVFAWQVLVLGDPVRVNGKPRSEIIVADACLKPVSQIDPSEVEELVKARARQDFDAAMADLGKILERHPMTDEELDAAINMAAEQSGITHALEVVPVVLALKDIGFRSTSPDSEDSFHWSGLHQGKELYVTAGPDMFGRVQIAATTRGPREMMWDERRLLAQEPRGRVFLLVLDLWRAAFGRDAPIPGCLQMGVMYEQHLDIRQRALGPALMRSREDGSH